jgi:tetratricopeptide (TPR) repeat protein
MRLLRFLGCLLASAFLLAAPAVLSAQADLAANTSAPAAPPPSDLSNPPAPSLPPGSLLLAPNTSLTSNSTILNQNLAPDSIVLPTTPTHQPATPAQVLSPTDDSWLLDLPSPVSPTRSQLAPGQNGVDSGIHRESHLLTSDANTRASGDTDTPEDQRLSDLAQQDHDFFQALDTNPNTWPDTERDRRAQAINDAYLKYLDDNPSNLQALILYGKFLRRVGEREAAYSVFQRAYHISNKTAVVNQQLGNYLAEEGQYMPALGFFIQAIEDAPDEPLYHYQLGELLNIYYDHYLAEKIYTEATLNAALTGEFAKAAALDPSEPGYEWRYAESYYDILDPDWNAALAAWEALDRRTTSDTEHQVIRLHRARVLIELGRTDQARALVNEPVLHALEASRQELLARLNNPTTPVTTNASSAPASLTQPSNPITSPSTPSISPTTPVTSASVPLTPPVPSIPSVPSAPSPQSPNPNPTPAVQPASQ